MSNTTQEYPQGQEALGGYARVPELWIADGNLVVVAGGTAFRLHKGLLARQSEVFRDLFSMSTPESTSEDASEELDGCPVIHVSDTAYDFRQLLHALYDPLRIFDRSDIPFSVLAALARMCHKYHMADLLSAVVRRLESIYPQPSSRLSIQAHTDRTPGEALMAVNLFRLLERYDMLVPALYAAAQLPTGTLLRGAPRGDGTPASAPEVLSAHDRALAIELKRELTTRKAFLFFTALGELPVEADEGENDSAGADKGRCTQVPMCTSAMLAAQRMYRQQGADTVDADPLSPLLHAELSRYAGGPLCRACIDGMLVRMENSRRHIWESVLPEFIGTFDAKQ